MSNLNIKLNTAVKTHIINKGLSTDQSTPKVLRRYFNLKSLDIKDDRMNLSLFQPGLEKLSKAATFRLLISYRYFIAKRAHVSLLKFMSGE